MRVGCVICSDSFSTFSDVATVPCGHTFHSHCLLQWLETSNSCPVCRQKSTHKKVLKLYFESIGSENDAVDSDSLQIKIDNLQFQLVERSQVVKTLTEKIGKYESDVNALRKECISREDSAKKQCSELAASRERIRHLSSQVQDVQKWKSEAKSAKSELALLQDVKELIQSKSEDIDATIISNNASSNCPDNLKNLATICCVLKSRVNKLLAEKKKAQDENYANVAKYCETKQALDAAEAKSREAESELGVVRADNDALEAENRSLQNKLRSLQSAITSPSGDLKDSLVKRLVMESPAPEELKDENGRVHIDITPDVLRSRTYTSQINSSHSLEASQQENESPFLRLKTASIPPLEPASSLRSGIVSNQGLFKHSKTDRAIKPGLIGYKNRVKPVVRPGESFGFNGLGVRDKVDVFPRAKRSERPVSGPAKRGPSANVRPKIDSASIKRYFSDPFSE